MNTAEAVKLMNRMAEKLERFAGNDRSLTRNVTGILARSLPPADIDSLLAYLQDYVPNIVSVRTYYNELISLAKDIDRLVAESGVSALESATERMGSLRYQARRLAGTLRDRAQDLAGKMRQETERTKERQPTPDDYDGLLNAIDMLIEMFQQVEKDTPEMFWWSMAVSEDITAPGGKDVTLYCWAELLQEGYVKELCNLGGTGNENSGQWTVYAVTGKGVTLPKWYKVSGVCESAIKALLAFYVPGVKMGISQYLNGFVRARDYFAESGFSVSQKGYWVPSWFEFIFNTADEFSCPIRVRSSSVHVRGWETVDVPFRHIENSVCEASILALKFLRNAAKRRLPQEPVETNRDKKSGNRSWKPPRGYIGSKAIVNGHKVPRSTLQGWAERDAITPKKDPQTQERYYPEKWFKKRFKTYKPRGNT
jgi:hypothetical protein